MFAVIYANSNHAPAVIISSYHEPLFRRRSPHIQEIYSYPIWISVFERDDIIKGKGQILKGPKQFIFENIINMLCNVLEERGLYKGVVAIEDDLIKKPKVKSMLLRRFPKSRLLEAEAVLWEIRKVKTNKEIEALKLAAELGVRGIKSIVEGGVVGKTMGQLHMKYKQGIMEGITANNVMEIEDIRAHISSGDHFSSLENSSWRVSNGDTLWVDCGVTAFGYNSDMGRTFFIGKPGRLKERLYEALKEGVEKTIARIKPGIKMKELFYVLRETVRKKGFEWYTRGHMGHMVGLGPGSIEQPPFISAEEETELEAGMVICVECGVYVTEHFGAFQIEDMLLVTSHGYEQLTKLPHGLAEITLMI